MKKNVYPIISTNISFSQLRDDTSLLVNLNTFKTKKLNKYQSNIVTKCNGKISIEEIIGELSKESTIIYTEQAVLKFINKMVSNGYLHWCSTPINIKMLSLNNRNCYTSTDYFTPSQLHTITVSVTESCCMECAHCSQNAKHGKGREFACEDLIRVLSEAYELGARYFGVFGGEPLMYPYLNEVVSYAFKKGYKDVIIFTKGTLIDYEKAKELRSIGIKEIQVSCDSHIPEIYEEIVGQQGAFSKFYEGIYNLMSVGITVKLKVVVTKKNIDSIPELIKYFTDLGIERIDIEVVVPVGRADFNLVPSSKEIYSLDKYIKTIKVQDNKKYEKITFKFSEYGKVKSCAGGIGSIMIFADGLVTPCDKWYEYRHVFNFGNIFNSSVKDIWQNGNYSNFRNLTENSTCQSCSKLTSCRGGCPLHGLIQNNMLGSADIACSKISGKDSGILFND